MGDDVPNRGPRPHLTPTVGLPVHVAMLAQGTSSNQGSTDPNLHPAGPSPTSEPIFLPNPSFIPLDPDPGPNPSIPPTGPAASCRAPCSVILNALDKVRVRTYIILVMRALVVMRSRAGSADQALRTPNRHLLT